MITEGTHAWHVVYTNPKCEDRVSACLISKGFGVYVPRYFEERTIRRIKVKRLVRLKLFPRYVFVLAPYGSWPRITATDGVVGLLKAHGMTGEPLTVSDEAIKDLMDRQAAGQFDRISKKRDPRHKAAPKYQPGTPVKILNGPFKEFYATVVEALDGYEAEIVFDLLGRQTAAKIALDAIHPVD